MRRIKKHKQHTDLSVVVGSGKTQKLLSAEMVTAFMKGGEEYVVISRRELDALHDTIDLLSDPQTAAELRESLASGHEDAVDGADLLARMREQFASAPR